MSMIVYPKWNYSKEIAISTDSYSGTAGSLSGFVL